jgi:hypothetical protein
MSMMRALLKRQVQRKADGPEKLEPDRRTEGILSLRCLQTGAGIE